MAGEKLNMSSERVISTIETSRQYSAASIPLALVSAVKDKKLKLDNLFFLDAMVVASHGAPLW